MSIQNKYIKGIIVLFCTMAMGFVQPVQQEDITSAISKEYIRSFPNEKINVAQIITKEGKISNKLIPIQLKASKQRSIVLNTIFASKAVRNVIQRQPNILNYRAWEDLSLFYGTSSVPTHHLMSRINRTMTVLGESALATLLVTPTVDLNVLESRQYFLKTLLQEVHILKQLKNSLKEYQKAEPSLLSFWTNGDPLYTQEYVAYMYRRFFSEHEQVNKSESKLRGRIFWRNLRDIYSNWFIHPLVGLLGCEAFYLADQIKSGAIYSPRGSFYSSLFPTFIPVGSIFYAIHTQKIFSILSAAIVHITAGWSYYGSIKRYQEYKNIFCHLAYRMRDVQLFVQAAAHVSEIIAMNPLLEKTYSDHLIEIRKLINAKHDKNSELGILIQNLQSMTFTNWSYFKGKGGKLLATFKLFIANKDAFLNAMYELGKLDAFMGIATLLKEAETYYSDHMYSFTKFLDRSQNSKPYIQIEDMWNPLLDARKAVGNNIKMGGDNVRNMILTGPNAGGKSTFLSGVAMSLLLSQTFGIAPAKEASITPFNKIGTYIAIADEIAMGKSLFMVEVERVRNHLTMLGSLPAEEFSFAIFDEPLSRTNPIDAMAAAYSILLHMAKFPNTVNIIATHYFNIMDLEENASELGFKNYKVFIEKDKNGKIHYAYKIVSGRGGEAIALDILEENGYDKSMIEEARNLIKDSKIFK